MKTIFGVDVHNDNWRQYIQLVKELNGIDDTDFNYYQIASNSTEFEFFKLEHLLWILSVNGEKQVVRSNLEINQGVTFQITCYFINCDFIAKLDTGQQRFGFKSHLLKSHLPSEIADKTCPKCGKKMKANLINSHYTQEHQDTFNCTFCSPILEFKSKIERDRHYREIHRDFFCNKCETEFTDFKEYHAHYVKNHKTQWKCGQCPEIFSNNNEYRVHFRKYHKNLWGCTFCDIIFDERTDYEKHYNYKHREYNCELCSIYFGKGKGSKNEYRRHYDRLHKKEWKCGVCNEILSSDAEYTNHRRSKHTHPKKCNSCAITLDNQKIYRHHRYIIHEKRSQEWEKCKIHELQFDDFNRYYKHRMKYHS